MRIFLDQRFIYQCCDNYNKEYTYNMFCSTEDLPRSARKTQQSKSICVRRRKYRYVETHKVQLFSHLIFNSPFNMEND